MNIDAKAVKALEARVSEKTSERIDAAVDRIVSAKERGGKVVTVVGSGPNVHEGVTTLLAELMRVGVLDGISTSSATVAHEMGGTLDKVKRVSGEAVEVDPFFLPKGGEFELTLLDPETIAEIERFLPLDSGLIERLEKVEGKTIIKAAGNLGYPMGLWMEILAEEIATLARSNGLSFEQVAGFGADPRTMIGQGALRGIPVLVTIPQLVGGGAVGLHIGDSLSLHERSNRLARMLAEADVVIESAVALTQEIHDGPLERYTGHGLWSAWRGHWTYSLEGKSLIRIDLDPALEKVWEVERGGGEVQRAIAEGLPKTKMFETPFRMEMSGYARHEGSLPVIGDIGAVWPILAHRTAERLGIELEFLSHPQDTPEGREMREEIVRDVRPLSREKMLEGLRERTKNEVIVG